MMSPNSPDRLDAAARAERHLRRARFDAAPGDLRVLRLERARDVRHGQVVPLQPRGVEREVDLPLAAAHDDDLADAAHAFELAAQRLVGVFGDVADRLVGRHGERHDRRRVRIELVHDGLLDVLRQERAARG
jgi:hypothetical protein